jgi:hypothetical protein
MLPPAAGWALTTWHFIVADIRQANGLELHAPAPLELSADSLQQHRVPVEIQELLLATGEHAHVYEQAMLKADRIRIDAREHHARRAVRTVRALNRRQSQARRELIF